jgi:hypothetical protein
VDAAVGFHEVIVEHVQVVAVDVDRGRSPVRVVRRSAVGGDANAVMEVSDGIVGDDVAGTVDFDCVIARE